MTEYGREEARSGCYEFDMQNTPIAEVRTDSVAGPIIEVVKHAILNCNGHAVILSRERVPAILLDLRLFDCTSILNVTITLTYPSSIPKPVFDIQLSDVLDRRIH